MSDQAKMTAERAREIVLVMPYKKSVDSPNEDCKTFWEAKGFLSALDSDEVKAKDAEIAQRKEHMATLKEKLEAERHRADALELDLSLERNRSKALVEELRDARDWVSTYAMQTYSKAAVKSVERIDVLLSAYAQAGDGK